MGQTCTEILDDYPVANFVFGTGQLGLIIFLIALIYLIMSLIIMFWIKKQEKNAKYLASDFESLAAKSVIFPVFVNVMWLNSFLNMFIGLVLIIVAGTGTVI